MEGSLGRVALSWSGSLERAWHQVVSKAERIPRRVLVGAAAGVGAYALLYARCVRSPKVTRSGRGVVNEIGDRRGFLTSLYWPHPSLALGGTMGTIYFGTRMPWAAVGFHVPLVEHLAYMTVEATMAVRATIREFD